MKFLCHSWILWIALNLARAAESSSEQFAGEALAARLREVRPDRPQTNQAVLKLRGVDGRKQIPVTVLTLPRTNGWEVRYEATLPGGIPERLVILHLTNQPPQYRGSVEGERIVGGAQSFAGSDFSRGDLGLEFLHWPRQRVLRRELSNGRMCDVLESRPESDGPYGSVRSWVDTKEGVLLSAEAYDERQVRVKQFSVTHFREVEDQWTFSLSMVDDRKGTKTELSYEPEAR
jgi:hypothetical protein